MVSRMVSSRVSRVGALEWTVGTRKARHWALNWLGARMGSRICTRRDIRRTL